MFGEAKHHIFITTRILKPLNISNLNMPKYENICVKFSTGNRFELQDYSYWYEYVCIKYIYTISKNWNGRERNQQNTPKLLENEWKWTTVCVPYAQNGKLTLWCTELVLPQLSWKLVMPTRTLYVHTNSDSTVASSYPCHYYTIPNCLGQCWHSDWLVLD